MVERVRTGRTQAELSRQCESSDQAIGNWLRHADRDDGWWEDRLTSAEREEIGRLRRELKQLRLERDVLVKPRPGSLGRPTRVRLRLRVHQGESGRLSDCHDVPSAEGLHER